MAEQINVTLPDGSRHPVEKGTPIADFVKQKIGDGLAKAAIFARVNGQDMDLSRGLVADSTLQVFTNKAPEALEVVRHDAAHVVASVVQRLYPGTQVTIGPTIEDGFYYDFFREQPFTPEDLARIEAEANAEIGSDLRFVRQEVSPAEAERLFASKGETFKVEIIKDIVQKGAQTLTLYSHGDWVDFCLGPHGPSTGKIGVIKLLSSSGAYWRGGCPNPMLQRIFRTAFFHKKAPVGFLHHHGRTKKREHSNPRKGSRLFYFHPLSPHAACWSPKGTALYQVLSDYMRKLTLDNGYVEVKTPLLYNKGLWEISGHWGKYRENMFLVLDNETGQHDF